MSENDYGECVYCAALLRTGLDPTEMALLDALEGRPTPKLDALFKEPSRWTNADEADHDT